MTKNFYYFKFIATEWLTGDIVYESFAVQGLFINICALYWQRHGKLSVEEINNRYKNPPELQNLTEKFFQVKKSCIKIKFLDEQLKDTTRISNVNKTNGLKGGRPKKEEKPIRFNSLTENNQSIVKLELELKEEVEVKDTHYILDDDILNAMIKLRPDVPREIMLKERTALEISYPNKSIPKDIKLIMSWCEKIKLKTKRSADQEFKRIEAKNKEKYGT